MKNAIKRQIASEEYDEDDPEIIPIPQDERFKAPKKKLIATSNALVFYLMDVL